MFAVDFNPLYIVYAWVGFVLSKWLYRISPLHPLYRFPTPSRFCVMTEWGPQFYWNLIRGGRFIFKISDWHKQYGPIIRIGPNELHINESSFYATAYQVGYKFSNYAPWYTFTTNREVATGIVDNVAHKERRGLLNPLFSQASVYKLDNRIRHHIDKFSNLIDKFREEDPNEGIHMGRYLRCLTIDIISEYAFSESLNTLDEGDLNGPYLEGMKNLISYIFFFQYFWPILQAMEALPYRFVKAILPDKFTGMLTFQKLCGDQVDTFLKDPTKAKAKTTHRTIFEALLEGNDTKGYRPPSERALKGEGWALVGAGMETTANSLTYAIWQACLNPHVQQRLHDELVAAFPDPEKDEMTLARCEKVHYLAMIVKETLRASAGVPGRLPRTVPPGGTTVAGEFIPAGAAVSMSAYLMHNTPEVYPDSHSFIPERFEHTTRDSLEERYLVPFSKGSRSCLGLNLAYAELYSTLAILFRKYKFKLHSENTLSDEWTDALALLRSGELVVTAEVW